MTIMTVNTDNTNNYDNDNDNKSNPDFEFELSDFDFIEHMLNNLLDQHPNLTLGNRGKNTLYPRHIHDDKFDQMVVVSDVIDSVVGDDLEDENDKVSGRQRQRQHQRRNHHQLQLRQQLYTNVFHQFAQIVCYSSIIPRKELFEAWGMALYVHHHFFVDSDNSSDDSKSSSNSNSNNSRSIRRVADLACSHGLLSWALLILRDLEDQIERNGLLLTAKSLEEHQKLPSLSSPPAIHPPMTAVCIDKFMPPSSEKLANTMQQHHPTIVDRWDYVEGLIGQIIPSSKTLLVGVHCCGTLSDQVIDKAIRGHSPLALVPCCHTHKCLNETQREELRVQKQQQKLKRKQQQQQQQEQEQEQEPVHVKSQEETNDTHNDRQDTSAIATTTAAATDVNVVDPTMMKFSSGNTTLNDFIDTIRIQRLQEAGFVVTQAYIPKEFSPKNRIILARPPPQTISTTTEDGTRTTTTSSSPSSSKYHIELNPVVTLFNRTFDIPVGDTEGERHHIRSISGRAAANCRRRRPPHTLSLSLWYPTLHYLSLQQLHEFVSQTIQEYGPSVLNELSLRQEEEERRQKEEEEEAEQQQAKRISSEDANGTTNNNSSNNKNTKGGGSKNTKNKYRNQKRIDLDCNYPVRLPIIFQRRCHHQSDDNSMKAGGGEDDDKMEKEMTSQQQPLPPPNPPEMKFKLTVQPTGTDRQIEGGYAQTYSIEYAIDDPTGTLPEITKTQAKALHIMVCDHVPMYFGGTTNSNNVRVRQTLGSKQLHKDLKNALHITTTTTTTTTTTARTPPVVPS